MILREKRTGSDFMNLLLITSKLIEESEQCIKRFEQMRVEDRAPDFFEEVKPHVQLVDELIQNWRELSLAYIQQYKPKYVHVSQINAAEEGMKQYIVQSFYKETSKKRFYQSVHAVLYTLKTLQTELESDKHDSDLSIT